jgi:hypothetical protein
VTPTDRLLVAGGAIYLAVTGWAMYALSYDIWGAFVVGPVLIVASIPLIRIAFSGRLAGLVAIGWLGLGAKLAGAVLGYVVRFDFYGGSADSERYHDVGRLLASDVRSGLATPVAVLPTGESTRFVEQLTGLVYTLVGSSRLAGFFVFAWFSYWGLVFAIKAASIAIPRFATRRYACLVFFFPSLVYWGSSTGKEAVVGLFLGAATYGAALLLADRGQRSMAVVLVAAGLVGAARVRPHFAAIWAGALVVALFVKLGVELVRRRDDAERRRSRLGVLVLLTIAGVGFVVVASVTLNYLDPIDQVDEVDQEEQAVTERLSSIFDDVEQRTAAGGSEFDPIAVDSPLSWPYAAVRTLTRPLLPEAGTLAELLPAVEMTALVVLALVSWRRLANLPFLLLRTPYLVFVLLCIGTFGVAFSSFGNLGLLVRQRSLVLPLLMVPWCLPEWWPAMPDRVADRVADRVLDRVANLRSTGRRDPGAARTRGGWAAVTPT